MQRCIVALIVYLLCTVVVCEAQDFALQLAEALNTANSSTDAVSTRFGFNFFSLGSCFTPFGQQGQCLSVGQCPLLITVWEQHKSQHVLNFMMRSVCNIDFNGLFYLCCPATIPLPQQTSPVVMPFRPGVQQIGPQTTPQVPQQPPVPQFFPGSQSSSTLPGEQDCGYATNTRIVGGVGSQRGEFPWLVALGFPQPGGGFQAVCGGSLISKRHVLTAAHCFSQQTLRYMTHVQVGDHSLSQTNDGGSAISVPIASRRNPGYDSKSQKNDIELVYLSRDVPFTNFIRPVCLPGSLQRSLEGSGLVVSGWGVTRFGGQSGSDTPLKATVTVIPLSNCQEAFRTVKNSPVIDGTHICAQMPGKDACQGDSGGPLIYADFTRGRSYLVGIVSYGVECANPKYPGVYTRVASFLPWINSNAF